MTCFNIDKEIHSQNYVDNTLYDVLKISRNATLHDIQNAFEREYIQMTSSVRSLMDVDLEKVQLLNYSYTILSDKSLRKIYDKGGILALEQYKNNANIKEQDQKVSQDNFLYELFGIKRNALSQEIQARYLEILKVADYKDKEKIKLIHSAYSILSVPQMRFIYDQEGIIGVKNKFPSINIDLKYFPDTENKSNDSILYDSLNIDKNASLNDIRQSYENALKQHEKVDGCINEESEEIQLLHASFNILSNPETREIYDKYGLSEVIKYQKEKENTKPRDDSKMDTILYETLGINRMANNNEIQTAYQSKLKDIEEFYGFVDEESEEYQLLSAAYCVLSDQKMRDIYDNGGLAAVNQYQEDLLKEKETEIQNESQHFLSKSEIKPNSINDHNAEIDNILYEIIGVNRNSSFIDIQLGYLKKLNDMIEIDEESEEMQLLHSAYNILSNPFQRKIYDQKGLEGINQFLENELKKNEGSDQKNSIYDTPEPDNLFPDQTEEEDVFHITDVPTLATTNENDVSPEVQNESNKETPKQDENLSYDEVNDSKQLNIVKDVSVELELEQLYNGCIITFNVEIDIPCPHCHGTGNEYSETFPKCDKCNGTGEILVEIDKPSYCFSSDFQPSVSDKDKKIQIKRICTNCMGRGEIISEADTCCLCFGLKQIKNDYAVNLRIEPGTKDNDVYTIPLKHLNNKYLLVKIIEKEHKYFQRIDNHLVYHKSLNLTQSLCGNLKFYLRTLDDRVLYINGENSKTISHNSYFIIKNEGFPIRDQSKAQSYGDLIIIFKVEMPNFFSISPKVISLLKMIQPLPDMCNQNVQPHTFKDKMLFYELPYSNFSDE